MEQHYALQLIISTSWQNTHLTKNKFLIKCFDFMFMNINKMSFRDANNCYSAS